MGDHEDWAQPSGIRPNGLMPNEAASVTRLLDAERWSKAEERIEELIARIQPDKPSEERRNAVADYVQRLIMKCFPCQVFTFGSVPLKTYLPDGDIDLTAFSKNQHLKDTWATEVRDMLESEEKSENAEFRVKEVQYIQAEVKLIKCLVENIVVDISFNQLGGLCTLCFLEEVDHLINQNHLFKRSIILIKAWCYYESRILGAHHGLISTYALETLVLYIFHVFNNSFVGPLEVLYRFLEFFSNFDWDRFCVSLWGPIPMTSLPDMTAEPPRKDNGELLLNKVFLDACNSVYAVFPGGQENQGQPFISKHFNVVDPLRMNNNLGRSVSKGNFFRIRSAFAFGAKRLARLLECPEENLANEVNRFFINTWERHGSGHRPDAPSSPLCLGRSLNPDYVDASQNSTDYSSSKKKNENHTSHESSAKGTQTFHVHSSQHGYRSTEALARGNNMFGVSRTQSQINYGNSTSSRVPDQVGRSISSIESLHTGKDPKISRADYLINEVQRKYQFARTRSSPELTDTSREVTTRGRRNRVPDGKSQVASKPDFSRRKNLVSDVSGKHGTRSSTDNPSSTRHNSFHQGLDAASNSTIPSSNYHDEADRGLMREELASAGDSRDMHQEEQDLINMMASSRLHSLGGQVQVPMNFAPPHLPLQASPSVLTSMGYQKNLVGMVPTNIPFVGPPWGSHIQFPHYFPSAGLASNTEDIVESSNDNTDFEDQEADCRFWHDDRDGGSLKGFESVNGGSQMLQSDDNKHSTAVGYNFIPLSRVSNHGSSYGRGQHRYAKENRGLVREEHNDFHLYQNNRGDDLVPSLRILPTSQASSSRSKASSESSWDASSVKTSKAVRDRRGRKAPSTVTSTVYGKERDAREFESVSVDNGSSQADDDNRDWIPLSTMDAENEEKNTGPSPVISPHFRSHQILNYEPGQTSGPESVMSVAPMLVGSGSRQRTMDNSGAVPFAFYLTGPPVPFLTMLPVYNIPTENESSEGLTSNFDREEVVDNGRVNHSDQSCGSAESLDQSDIFTSSNSTNRGASVEPLEQPSEEHKPDILHSDFNRHWHNLQYGRFCQNPRPQGPLIYPPYMVPPMYLQGHFPWEGPGRPASPNSSIFNQLMSYGPHLIPVAPLQPGSNRPPSAYQRYGDESPRYRGGTGTYLPNFKVSSRERQSSNTRNHRSSYNYDRNDHNNNDREGNWNNLRPRASGRSYSRSQVDKLNSRSDRLASNDSRAERPWESNRHDSFPSYQSQSQSQSHNGPFVPSSSKNNVSGNVAYSMHPLPAANSNGIAPTGASVVMLYPYDNRAGYGSSAEQLEFGTLGAVKFSGNSEASQLDERGLMRGVYEQHRFQGGSPVHSSPDQPSSPQLQR